MSTEYPIEKQKWSPFVPSIDDENPWPGLAAYPVWSEPYFFGREEEIEELLRLIRREDLAIVHGKSGVGKTSLLQAGLIPLLDAEDCMPVFIRLDHDPAAPALVDQVKFAIAQAMLQARIEGPIADDRQTLWEYFHRRGGQFWGPRNRLLTPVLIFNQFEEIFSLGCDSDETRKRTNEFLPQLVDLIDNRQPLDVRRRLIDGSADSSQWNFEESGCKVVLCLRKEYVTDLDFLALRSLSDDKRLSLGMLRGDHAVDAVARAGAKVLDLETAERIVRFCADSSMAVDAAPVPVTAPNSNVGHTPPDASPPPGSTGPLGPKGPIGPSGSNPLDATPRLADGAAPIPRSMSNPSAPSAAPVPRSTSNPGPPRSTATAVSGSQAARPAPVPRSTDPFGSSTTSHVPESAQQESVAPRSQKAVAPIPSTAAPTPRATSNTDAPQAPRHHRPPANSRPPAETVLTHFVSDADVPPLDPFLETDPFPQSSSVPASAVNSAELEAISVEFANNTVPPPKAPAETKRSTADVVADHGNTSKSPGGASSVSVEESPISGSGFQLPTMGATAESQNKSPSMLAPTVAGRQVAAPTDTRKALNKLEVEPALLSLICRELNAERIRLGHTHIDAEQLRGTPADILKSYYERAIGDAPQAMRAMVEDRLLTKFGLRKAIMLEQALAIDGVSADAIKALVDRQLLRVDDRLGTTRLELAHDVLIEPVRQSRDARLAAEEEALLERIRRDFAIRMRRTRVGIAIGLALCVVALLSLGGLILMGMRQSKQQADRAARAEQKLTQAEAEKLAIREAADKASADAKIQLASAQAAYAADHDALGKSQAAGSASEKLAAAIKVERDAALAAKEQTDRDAAQLRGQIAVEHSRVEISAAESSGREGDLLFQSGKPEEALAAYSREVKGLSGLEADALKAPEVQRMVADANEKLGNLVLARKDISGARGYLETAQASLHALISNDPKNVELRHRSLNISRSLIDMFQQSDAGGARRLALLDGLSFAKELHVLAPSDAEALRCQYVFSNELAKMDLATTDGVATARVHFADAAEALALLLTVHPSEPQGNSNLLMLYSKLGQMSLSANAYQDAADWYSLGLKRVETPSGTNSDGLSPWLDPAELMHGRGLALWRLNQLAAARSSLETEIAYRTAHARPDDSTKIRADWQDLATISLTLADYADAKTYLQKQLALAAKSAQLPADELPTLYGRLGKSCLMVGDVDSARNAYLAGLKIDGTNASLKRGLADVYAKLAKAQLKDGGDYNTGRTILEEAAKLYAELGAADPRDPELRRVTLEAYQRLGDIALQHGDARSSRLIYDRYTTIAEASAAAVADNSDPDLVQELLVGYDGLGSAYFEMRDLAMTRVCFEKYRHTVETHSGDKDSAAARHNLAVMLGNLGHFSEKLDAKAARDYFEQEIKMLDALPSTEKNTLEAAMDLSQGLGKLASLCIQLDDNAAAVATYQRAVEVDEALTKTNPNIPILRLNASASNTGLGDATLRSSGADASRKFYLRGAELAKTAVDADANASNKLVLSQSLRQCGYMSSQLKEYSAALSYYQRAQAIDEQVASANADNADAQLGRARDLIGIGDAARGTHDEKTAVGAFAKATEIVNPLRAMKTSTGTKADKLFQSLEQRRGYGR